MGKEVKSVIAEQYPIKETDVKCFQTEQHDHKSQEELKEGQKKEKDL